MEFFGDFRRAGRHETNKKEELAVLPEKPINFFIIQVDDPDTVVRMDSKGESLFELSFADVLERGMTIPLRWFPYILTYDDTEGIYVMVYEPPIPVYINNLRIYLIPPEGKTITYWYFIGTQG